ncbi:peptidoglycan amidohydrolase family protein [Enterococcus cecorum]|uniref:peptidoglycan amidohydrolase family protein n=1 Tax=Enterococcus cecorum TaxID=44008 RepID=UPI000AC1569C|nr:peptidoglycan amidohydrolase family protein [Enterococcus cecorum]CAI3425840.1 SH3 domain-containing protein [Enterococcus cecorum]
MIDMDTAIDYMYGLRAKNIRYSMDYSRTGADGTGDCSGTVYAALRKAGASDAGWVVNTDSMHGWLVTNGFRLIAHNKAWSAKRDDIVIFGEKGKSGGVAGHVVIFISNTQIIHCTWKSDSVNGVFIENEATACPYRMGWYVYRLDQKTSSSQPKISAQVSKPAADIQWISEKWHFITNIPIYLRTAPTVQSDKIALLGTGSYIQYDAYGYKDGYVWLRQPRTDGTYGYLASGECVGHRRTSYWGSFD